MWEYQKNRCFFAQLAEGMEELAKKELQSINATEIKPTYLGVYFEGDNSVLYRINYTSRIFIRILAPLASFDCKTTEFLYQEAVKLPWSDLFKLNNSFAIFSTVSNSNIRHSQYAGLCLKDAIVDNFRNIYGRRPNVDTEHPDLWINLHIENDKAVINLDTSGGSLHRRGYRKKQCGAPMVETLAAAIIKLSGWDGSCNLYDPMCGSGTLLSEALMNYCRIPAAIFRKRFGFEFLPDFDQALWQKIQSEENNKIRPLPANLIAGSDINPQAVSASKINFSNLKYGDKIQVKSADFRSLDGIHNAVIICNPPYGVRMSNKDELAKLYQQLGDFLKQHCQGSTAYIYTGERELIKKIGLRTTWKKPLKNGALDGRLLKIDIY